MKKRATCIWFTGLPSSGKTTLSNALAKRFKEGRIKYHQLDGDEVRKSPLSKDSGYSFEDRERHLMRVAEVSRILIYHNIYILAAFVSPQKRVREKVRKHLNNRYIEVYVECDKETCMLRDDKGMWRDAYMGKMKFFTGINQEYEEPTSPEILVNTEQCSIEQCVNSIWQYLKDEKYIS